MTEFAISSSSRPGFGPATLPAVSWFEFVLDESLLEKHLSQSGADPSAFQLIVQFLQQAEAQSNFGPIPGKDQSNNDGKTDSQPPELKIPAQNRKVKALKILALKVAGILKWDLGPMAEGIPITVLQSLLLELVRAALGTCIDKLTCLMDYPALSDEAVFALQLYHRWCVETIVDDSFPGRPPKPSFVPVPGLSDSLFALAGINDSLIRILKEQISISLENLHSFIEKCRDIRLPVADSFGFPSEHTDIIEDHWEKGILVPADEYRAQIMYTLGSYYFFLEDYVNALDMFKQTEKLFVPSGVYCKVNESRLKGYLIACCSMREIPREIKEPTLFDQAEITRTHEYQGLVDIFIEDCVKRELSLEYRLALQAEIAHSDSVDRNLLFQVTACNVVYKVMERNSVLSEFIDSVQHGGQKATEFLLKVLSLALRHASASEKTNLKCFTGHMAQVLPRETKFVALLTKSDVYTHFSEDECIEMTSFEDDDDFISEELTFDYGVPVSRGFSNPETSTAIVEAERQLLYEYDPMKLEELVSKLTQKWGRHPSQIMALTDHWCVPKDIQHSLESMPASKEQAYAYILVAKAKHCMSMQKFDVARQLLTSSLKSIKDLSHPLKLIGWQILVIDIQDAFHSTMDFQDCSDLQNLVNRTKACLSGSRLSQDLYPSSEVMEYCSAFLLNVQDWDFFKNLENFRNEFLELSYLLGNTCKMLPVIKNARKPARELLDAVVQIFSGKTPQKRARDRDSQLAIMSKEKFTHFIKKLKEPVVLTTLISCLTKLYNTLKDDITSDIFSSYLTVWPTALGKSLNIPALADVVSSLMSHAVTVNPLSASWLRTQADIYFAHGQYTSAMKYYLEVGVVSTNFFSLPIQQSVYDEKVYRRMMKCCSYLQCHTQVAVLSQFLEEPDYATAFKALQERNSYDAMDTYYSFMWDVSILEYLANLHSKRGEIEKKQLAIKALGQMDLNSNNPEEILEQAIHQRKNNFLRALAKLYL